MKNSSLLTVSQLNYYIKSLFDGDEHLSCVFVVGEISNFTDHYQSGHFYFSLKDEKCTVKAVMFSSSAKRVRFRPQNGMRVLVRGRVSVYENSGQYQLYAEDMQPDGLGALNLQFEQLKRRLSDEGLFDQEKKKPIPPYPERVGVITSPTGAAIRDIKNVLFRRFPAARVVFCPVLVQGEEAPEQIIDAIGRFNKRKAADVLILGRGGGSIEDLWAFNDENVARAVAKSNIPIISAVGHETDFTICDFAASLRAPTPSAAAELAVPDTAELLYTIGSYQSYLKKKMFLEIQSNRAKLERLLKIQQFVSPVELVKSKRLRLSLSEKRLKSSFLEQFTKEKEAFTEAVAKLEMMNPLKVLTRGYCVTFTKDGRILKTIEGVEKGDPVTIKVRDGEISCTVEKKKGQEI